MARVFTDAGAMALASAASQGKLFDGGVGAWAFWIYRTAAPAAERGLVGMGDFTTDVGWWVNLTATGLINSIMPFGTTNRVRTSSTATALNGWTHVVASSAGKGTASTDFTFHINGKPEAGTSTSTGAGAAPVAGSFAAKIGPGPGTSAAANTLAPPANFGVIAFWNRPLTDAEALALAAGAHPLRFKEGLVEVWDMAGGTWEEGYLGKVTLIQGATNPTSAFVNPPVILPQAANDETRQNVRPIVRSKARYNVAAVSGVIASTSLAVPIAGVATVTVDIASSSSKTVAISGAVAVAVAVVADSSKQVPIGGSATAAVDVQAQSAKPVPIGGSASATVLVQTQTTKQVPISGSITGVIGNPPISADSLAQVPLGGSAVLAIAIAALSARQVPVSGSAAAQVLVAAQSIRAVPLTGLAAAMVGVAAQSARAIPIGGLVDVSVIPLNNGRYLTTATAASSRYRVTGFSRSRFQVAASHGSQHQVEDSSSSSLESIVTAAPQFTIRSTT